VASDDSVTMSAVSQLLGSLWALTLAALAASASVLHTAPEDWILQCDLDGYAGCACSNVSSRAPGRLARTEAVAGVMP
jgi:invasion protein IalB